MSFKEYASKEYAFQKQWGNEDAGKFVRVNEYGVVEPAPFLITEQSTGYTYYVYIENGKLTTSMSCIGIEIVNSPIKTEYYAGQLFNPDGMVVDVIYQDGSRGVITDYTFDEKVKQGQDVIKIKYVDRVGAEHFAYTPITIIEFDPSIILRDFNYYQDDYGYYVLSGWKQTLNGVSSTELIVPDYPIIRV